MWCHHMIPVFWPWLVSASLHHSLQSRLRTLSIHPRNSQLFKYSEHICRQDIILLMLKSYLIYRYVHLSPYQDSNQYCKTVSQYHLLCIGCRHMFPVFWPWLVFDSQYCMLLSSVQTRSIHSRNSQLYRRDIIIHIINLYISSINNNSLAHQDNNQYYKLQSLHHILCNQYHHLLPAHQLTSFVLVCRHHRFYCRIPIHSSHSRHSQLKLYEYTFTQLCTNW